jgi:uroporphyrin-III C-methyltransferase/precorrin-2 dehydrogenase/sirohydrochlorin ferrochelatase
MDSLPVFLRLRGRPVILIGEGEAAAAKRRLLERAAARIVGEEAEAQLALVATDAPEAVVARLRARGILVNTADRPDLCDFTLPAIVERDPVLIAIGTGGASAGLAKALRQRIEALLPGSAGRLAQALARAREPIRKRWLDPFADHGEGAVSAWLGGRAEEGASSGLVSILLRSGDPDDLTLREARLLGQCDRIYHRPDVPTAILDRARADAVRIAAKRPRGGEPGLTLDIDWDDR